MDIPRLKCNAIRVRKVFLCEAYLVNLQTMGVNKNNKTTFRTAFFSSCYIYNGYKDGKDNRQRGIFWS